MKRKRLLIFGIIVVAIASLIAVPRIVKNNKIRNEIKPVVESWANMNNISIKSFSFGKRVSGGYSISVVCDEFESLTAPQMINTVKSWNSSSPSNYYLDLIISNGNRFKVEAKGTIYSYKDQTRIGSSSSSNVSSGGSSSSSSQKTATCNYCNGTGRVNGDKCPWCNGSGKTYDNVFNDALAD